MAGLKLVEIRGRVALVDIPILGHVDYELCNIDVALARGIALC